MNQTALIFFALLCACTPASSTDIRTSGLYASITGTGDGSGQTTVTTTLQVGQLSTTFIDIASGDALTATSGTDTTALKKFELLGLISYSGVLPGDDENKSVTVAFTRGAGDTSAPNSSLALPAKFQLTAPVANAAFARGKDAIEVKWGNSGKSDPMAVQLKGSCIQTVTQAASDTGSVVIAAADLKASKDAEAQTCDVTIDITRTHTGTLDPAYGKGGSALGIQRRSVVVKSSP